MARTARRKTPWESPDPKPPSKRRHLTPAQKRKAAARAKRAGRPYPNLVDNMAVTREAGAGKARKKRSSRRATPRTATSRKAASRKTASRGAAPTRRGPKKRPAPTKRRTRTERKSASRRDPLHDPRGGLTAAGREHFRRSEGAHLRPGVKKRESEMTAEEMRRKGSWAARFYGRETLPPLVDADGRPRRFALSAAAWGEPVPRTEAAARRIAARGRRLLERAKARSV